jgi:hypothetical protein
MYLQENMELWQLRMGRISGLTDVSEELTASIIRAMMEHLLKVGQYLPDYTVQHSENIT